MEVQTVYCLFSKEHARDAAMVDKNQTVTIRGTVSGLMMNVQMKNCEFVKNGKKSKK